MVTKEVRDKAAEKDKGNMPNVPQYDPSKDPKAKQAKEGSAPMKQDDTNAESSMENYEDAGGEKGVSKADAESEGKTIPDRTLKGRTEDDKTPETKAKGKDTDGDEKRQRQLGASDEMIAAKKAYDDHEKDYGDHPQISRTYDGEEDVAAVQKRRNAERAYKQKNREIPEKTGYVFLDQRPKQKNIGAGEEVSQGEYQTKEVIKKEDANVENR